MFGLQPTAYHLGCLFFSPHHCFIFFVLAFSLFDRPIFFIQSTTGQRLILPIQNILPLSIRLAFPSTLSIFYLGLDLLPLLFNRSRPSSFLPILLHHCANCTFLSLLALHPRFMTPQMSCFAYLPFLFASTPLHSKFSFYPRTLKARPFSSPPRTAYPTSIHPPFNALHINPRHTDLL